ncbi:hypothetical protein B0H16DRAFT_1732692 [Mycena metata]|uniref:CxC2-like cysteine cluster KDZ transposase-associated domain-containing protein n=1 Tax=Mycena metata TaxID=1033252 RepID=A0AAD7MVP3_9AGAR|nr:hypothetical protein B0H16DRAFT_1732692 [Mycena metata]
MLSTKRKKRPTNRNFTRAESIPTPSAASSSTTRILREKVSIRQSDGHVRQLRSVVDVAGYPEPAKVHSDVPRSRPVYDWYSGGDLGVDRDEEGWEDEDEGPRAPRNSDNPLGQWAEDHLTTYLTESLRLEGRGDHARYTTCPRCAEGSPDHRCRHCLGGGELLCRDCIVLAHSQLPFHQIEYWTGEMFERTTLKALGLRIQLGHWYGATRVCPNPQPAIADDFVIVDLHGVHNVALDYCGCGTAGHPTVQLLRAQLWPATTTNPKTASTFAVLRQYHVMSFESKCSALEFYRSLERQSDNLSYKKARQSKKEKLQAKHTGSRERKKKKDRYNEFLRMTRQWRHVRMLKRAARGHDPQGIDNTQPGECALLCPACPHPGKNLVPGWEEAPTEKEFLYALFLGMDANFRLKRKDVSTEEKDPGLCKGWAFYGEVGAYMTHVKKHWNDKQDRSHCVAHDAVDKPDREARGTASSGIGAVDCARHNMKRPLAVGDLQLGERYINMDYMFFRSIAGSSLRRFVVSYDIVCQWHIHVWDRMRASRNIDISIGGRTFMTFLIPKFYLPAHIEACNLKFSFNLTRDVGQTDGEAPERGWANANPLARSTKEMGPGSRRDTLDDHFNDWNHKRIIALGYIIRRKTKNAVAEMVRTRQALEDLESSLGPAVVNDWEAMALAWEEDSTAPNPFETLRKDLHVAKVRAELAEEAAVREAAGEEEAGSVRGDMHITELLAMGLQLEDQQRILAFDVASTGLHPTDGQRRAMIERTSKLRRKIFAWVDVQTKFYPGLKMVREWEDEQRAERAGSDPVPGVSVSDIALWLPSAIAAAAAQSLGEDVPVTLKVYQHEYRLRVGQAEESLHEVRRLLLVRTHVYQLKDEHARGVRANMRSQDKIASLNEQTQRSAQQYRAARLALVSLGAVLKRHDWERTLRELKADDVQGLPQSAFHDPERKKRKKRRRQKKVERAASWIWVTPGAEYNPADGAAMNEAVRIEWAKVRARSLRWREEVDLLEEEMGRVIRFFFWRAGDWRTQVGRNGHEPGPQLEGETAYALRQAAVQMELAEECAEDWEALPELIRRGRAGELEADEMTGGAAGARGALNEADGSDEEDEDDYSSEGEEDDPVPTISGTAINPTHVDEVMVM